ncbi:MAG: hypothetical protein COT84_02335 [Chlamydiae bacterium CG10_big_fil_rev_8_21_14_0_10_35_9]|nr:MAG: hypothetical protein COT84_02335 [Chlamydiae bacterium CG10_big_fil_rev_8_21_14_0_10_35_9]
MNFYKKLTKAEACGNTFLIFEGNWPQQEMIQEIILQKVDSGLKFAIEKEIPEAIFVSMKVLEKDGSISEFCGNGARCIAAYLKTNQLAPNKKWYLIKENKLLQLGVSQNNYFVEASCFPTFQKFTKNAFALQILGSHFFFTQWFNEPHLVTFDNLGYEKLYEIGKLVNSLKYRQVFPKGTNINAVAVKEEQKIENTTFERGVNAITRACGSGSACASWLFHYFSSILKNNEQYSIQVLNKGGTIEFSSSENNFCMKGEALVS